MKIFPPVALSADWQELVFSGTADEKARNLSSCLLSFLQHLPPLRLLQTGRIGGDEALAPCRAVDTIRLTCTWR